MNAIIIDRKTARLVADSIRREAAVIDRRAHGRAYRGEYFAETRADMRDDARLLREQADSIERQLRAG